MFRSLVLRKVIAGILILSVSGMVACGNKDAGPVTVPDPPPEPDIVDDGGDTKASAWLAGNPWHEEQMGELLTRPDVSAEVTVLEGRGYELCPSGSFTIAGGDATTDVAVTFITLRTRGGDDTPVFSATIACYSAGDGGALSTIETTVSPPRAGGEWQLLNDPVWYRATGPDRSGTMAARPDWWDWGFLGDCLSTRAPGAAGGCAVSCLLIPGYWHCFLWCVGSQAISATITCIVQMYQANKKAKKEI